LHGLEAWFRTPQGAAPPRWKMAVATLAGVYPTSAFLGLTVGPLVKDLPYLAGNLIFAAVMVAALTWAVMPLVTRLLHSWLHSA
jgi:antibiotic biosynthesis monooxygenase (ABM) superfamily enzyme